jgi:hypothetical protein
MLKLLSLILITILPLNSFAGLIELQGTPAKKEKINIFPKATTNVAGETISMTSIGSGIRSKKVVFVNVNVYVGQLLVSNPESFNLAETEALSSLKNQKTSAIILNFLRDVEAEKVQNSFKEALVANKVNLEETSIRQFLEAVTKGGVAQNGKTIVLVGSRLKDGQELISYESSTGSIVEIKGSSGLIEKIFSIWLGNPADEGIANLKKSLLTK